MLSRHPAPVGSQILESYIDPARTGVPRGPSKVDQNLAIEVDRLAERREAPLPEPRGPDLRATLADL
jgi:hypothetical protein